MHPLLPCLFLSSVVFSENPILTPVKSQKVSTFLLLLLFLNHNVCGGEKSQDSNSKHKLNVHSHYHIVATRQLSFKMHHLGLCKASIIWVRSEMIALKPHNGTIFYLLRLWHLLNRSIPSYWLTRQSISPNVSPHVSEHALSLHFMMADSVTTKMKGRELSPIWST